MNAREHGTKSVRRIILEFAKLALSCLSLTGRPFEKLRGDGRSARV